MICGKYKDSEEVLRDIEREIEVIGSASLNYKWSTIRQMTTKLLKETDNHDLTKKFFVDTVDLNNDLLIVDGVLAIYEAFTIQLEKSRKAKRNKRKIIAVYKRHKNMTAIEILTNGNIH